MSKRTLLSLVTFVLLDLVVIGCGVSCGTITASKSPNVDKIQQRGILLVGTTGDYRPLSYKEPDTRLETMDMSEGYLGNGKTILCRKEDAGKYTCQEDLNYPEVRVMVNPGSLKALHDKYNLQYAY